MKKVFSVIIELIIFSAMFYALSYMSKNVLNVTYFVTIIVMYLFHAIKSKIISLLKLNTEYGVKVNSTLLKIKGDGNSNLIGYLLIILVTQLFIYPLFIYHMYELSFFKDSLEILNYFVLSSIYIMVLELILEPAILNGCFDKIIEYGKSLEQSKNNGETTDDC